GEEVHSPVDVRQDQADRFDNKIDVLGKAFLGLTVACARCHDHKFDAISAKDYYALYGILSSSSYHLARFDSMGQNRRVAADLWRLGDRARPILQRAVAEAARQQAERLADYLLAARDVMRRASDDQPCGEEIARARKLDAELLGRWVARLTAAVKDGRDPLHAWAKVATEPTQRPEEVLRPVVERWRKAEADAEAARKNFEVVIDYGKARPEDWLPDGVAFGPGPVYPGDFCLGDDPAHSVTRVHDRAAAARDRAFDVLRLAPGVENDPGALAGW